MNFSNIDVLLQHIVLSLFNEVLFIIESIKLMFILS